MCQQTGVFGDQRHWQRHVHLAWATQKRYTSTPPTNNFRSPATIWVEYVAPYPRLVACDEATKEQRPMRQRVSCEISSTGSGISTLHRLHAARGTLLLRTYCPLLWSTPR